MVSFYYFFSGVLKFSQKPNDVIYLRKGSDVVLKWDYAEKSELQFIDWKVYNKTAGKYVFLRVEDENGTAAHNPAAPWPPAAYVGRIEREGRATIIIKNITIEDAANFKCTLTGKPGVGSIGSDILLVVTGTMAFKVQSVIDHFHYDVTRAKVSGSCSKDRAQCRAIAGKCQKISRSAMSAKASYQQVFYKVMCSIAIQFKEIQRGVFCLFFFFSVNEELRSVVS